MASGYSWSPVWLKYRMHIIYLTIDDHSGTGELDLLKSNQTQDSLCHAIAVGLQSVHSGQPPKPGEQHAQVCVLRKCLWATWRGDLRGKARTRPPDGGTLGQVKS